MDREIWDENRWEAFLKESDRHLERYMNLLFRFMSDNPPPGESDRQRWQDELRAYLLSNGMQPEDDLGRTEWGDVDRDLPGVDEDVLDVRGEDVTEALDRLDVYRPAHELAARVLRWSNRLPGHVKDSTLVQFCSYVTQIPANIAKGHGIGYEMDMIGGNIACAKRALTAANAALELLREMRTMSYVDPGFYRTLYEEAFHVRNSVGIHVQELRARFNLGVD